MIETDSIAMISLRASFLEGAFFSTFTTSPSISLLLVSNEQMCQNVASSTHPVSIKWYRKWTVPFFSVDCAELMSVKSVVYCEIWQLHIF